VDSVHRVSARFEEEVVEHHVGHEFVDSGAPRSFGRRRTLLPSEDAHDLGVQLGHQDLEGLVGLSGPHAARAVQRMQRVQVPAVSVHRAKAVSGAIWNFNNLKF